MRVAGERLRRVLGGLFPADCLLCTARAGTGRYFCPACQRALPRLRPACPVCAAPGPAAVAATPAPCGRCQRQPPAYARVRAPFRYAAPVDRLVQGAKYAGRLDWLAALAQQTAAHLAGVGDIDVVVPVPLHRARLRQRGYNQSLELARPVARALRLPLCHALVRARPTLPQAGLPAAQRRANVRGAFAPVADLSGARVALVDDVMTSGATADAAAASLRAAGAASVEVWVVARA